MSILQTRALSTHLLKQLITPVCTQCVKNIQKHLIRSITDEHVIKLEQTFLGRLLLYINNDESLPIRGDRKKIIKTLRNNEKEIEKFKTEEIISALTSFSNYHYVGDRYEYSQMINVLDTEFCKRLNNLKTKEKFNILHAYMKVVPNKIIQYNYYKKAVEELFNKLDVLNKREFIQLIFYIGLQKKSSNSQYLLKSCVKTLTVRFLNDLTTEELCIICNSTFKTSTKIDNTLFLDKIISHINDNLLLCNDTAILITLIKTIRHNRYASEDLLTTLSYTIFFNKTLKCYSFSALCHILALYADFFYYDENLIKIFVDKCIEQIKDDKDTNLKKPRVKDIKRFIWCLYNINYKLKLSDIKDILIPNIMKRLEAGEFGNDLTSLIDIMLYLWALNYRAHELVPYVLTKENIQLVKASKSPAKNKLNLLLSCIYFEDKPLYRQINSQPPENPKYDAKFELNQRPMLRKVLECLQKTIVLQSDINKFEVGYQVPYLKIVGITGYRKNIYKTIHIEVLDEYTSLKNTDHVPIGLMQLKLRILEELEEGLIVISANELEELTDMELCSFLQDEINFVS